MEFNMKSTAILFLSFLGFIPVYAQQNGVMSTNERYYANTVTVIVIGNKDLQLSVDGGQYISNSNATSGNTSTFNLNDLKAGYHTIVGTRTDPNTNKQERMSAAFQLRNGFNMLVQINGNGSLELIETKTNGVLNADQVPMSTVLFNNLRNSVRNQRSPSQRQTLVSNAFENTDNYFTTWQVMQLLRLINSENNRLQLAKTSFRSITDSDNFSQVYSLFNSQVNKNELESYVNNYDYGVGSDDEVKYPMNDAAFGSLYQTIKQQWPVSAQMNSLTAAFNNTNNFFSTYQASQLIQLVTAENNRLQLAKLSYRTITDPTNFIQVINLFGYQSRDELNAYINNYAGSNGAMTDASFNSLFQRIKNEWPINTQLNSLTTAFNNTGNFFTAYQASQLIQLINSESDRLQLAKLSYRGITDRNNFTQIVNLLSYQSSRDELNAYVKNNGAAINNIAMTSTAFNSLYQTIKQQWPSSTQINSLTSAFNNTGNFFTTYQVSQLIQLINGESDRLQLAKLSYRSIIDRNNFIQVVNLLGYQSSKDELTAYVNNYSDNSNPNPTVAMTDANFNSLYQSIQAQFFPGEQMSTLTNVFNNTSNFFTTAQVKQLIPLVSYESNRLILAKLSYRSIIDRNNFNQLYDLLSSQASRNELDAYVKAYKD